MSAVQSGQAEIKKYQTYLINVDPNQDDKATEIKLCNFSRPHMRAFHCSWFAFFIAFFIWFAIAPLMPEITTTLGLNKQQIWTANILSVAGTILMRFVIGPLCDKYGARILMGIVLILAAIPCACTGLVQNATGLAVLRFFIGLGGSTFVMCQYWTSRMFTKEVVGKANGIVAGWGNLGGGVTQLVMGSILFPLFKTGMSAEMAWRTCPIVPAVVAIFVGVAIFYISDDAPKGNYKEMTKNGTMAEVSAAADFRSGAVNFNTWVLFIQYACCFGVELTMNNAAALYFSEKFLLTTEIAAMIASLFGWMNLFTRGLGGYISDKCNAKVGMRGRLWWQTACLVLEGLMVLVFAQCNSLTASIIVLVIFSTFVQVSEGSTFGIVPYIDSAATGSISGIVGAGGNVGAVCFGLAFRYQLNYYHDFMIMGGIIIASGVLSLFICIKGHAGLISGQDSEEAIRAWKKLGVDTPTTTLQVPVPDEDAAADIEEDA